MCKTRTPHRVPFLASSYTTGRAVHGEGSHRRGLGAAISVDRQVHLTVDNLLASAIAVLFPDRQSAGAWYGDAVIRANETALAARTWGPGVSWRFSTRPYRI